jgi:DnaJ family protein B protein 11
LNDHPIFKKSYYDLHITLNITLKEALVGFERKITLLDNTDLIIKSENIVSPYTQKIIKNTGFTKEGSLVINFEIQFPDKLDI